MEERGWIAVCFFLSLISALLQIAAYVSPMWLWIVDGPFYQGIGLWYYTGCGANCTSQSTGQPQFSTTSNAYYNNSMFNALRGLETAALVGAILVCIFITVLLAGWRTWTNMVVVRIAALVVSVITWLCMIIGIIVYAVEYNGVIYYSPQIFNPASFPWSFLLAILALILMGLVTLFIICCTKPPEEITGIPISGDSKMALTPTVTNANNGKKYFVPSPYTDDRRINNFMATDDNYSRRSYAYDREDTLIVPNGYGNGYNNKGFISEYNDRQYTPTGYRPHSYAEPTRYKDDISYRSAPQPNFQSLDRPRNSRYQESRYSDRDDAPYSRYVERPRPPAGARSVLPPITNQDLSRSRYTDEVKIGASTAYIYRPYSQERY